MLKGFWKPFEHSIRYNTQKLKPLSLFSSYIDK